MQDSPLSPSPADRDRAAAVARLFRTRFGVDAEGVWAAPGRVNLIGEHTDYNDGFVLPFALTESAYVAVRRHGDGALRLVSEQSGDISIPMRSLAPGSVTGWPAYLAGAVWALGASGVTTQGLDLLLDSDVPVGAGLSSSAAIECATTLAVANIYDASLSRSELALSAHRAEVEMAGVPCGLMDQTVSMCAEPDHALFLDCRSRAMRQVPLPLRQAGLIALVIDTQAPHRLVSGEYAARRRSCEAAARAMGHEALRDATLEQVETAPLDEVQRRRARHVVSENARVSSAVDALDRGDLEALGPLLSASHASLRDDFEVSVPELDVAADAATRAGALGARMIGGGFGGCVLALVREAEVDRVFEAVVGAFSERDFAQPGRLVSYPAAGARRII